MERDEQRYYQPPPLGLGLRHRMVTGDRIQGGAPDKDRPDALALAVDDLTKVLRALDYRGDEENAERIRGVLDQLTGFCSPRMRLTLPPPSEARTTGTRG